MLAAALPLAFVSGAEAQQVNHHLDTLGFLPYQQPLNDVWGYVDKSGKEYALVGTYTGFSIVDVSTPSNPVEIQFFPGQNSTWRDVKVWKDHAYVTNESGDGVLIVNMSGLPEDAGSLPSKNFTEDSLQTQHNIYIDENGVAYLFGANIDNGGASMYDVDTDPWNPVKIGAFDDYYLHDGFVRGDTLYGAAVYGGFFNIVDISDKQNPVVLATQQTSFSFTHNVWPSDDGKVLFTTDEKADAFIGAYDISDLGNIEVLDEWKSEQYVIPHNAHVLGERLVTSYYTSGIIVHDISRPHNLVEIGRLDYSPYSGWGFNGSWGAYPFLPSGNLLNADIERGLEVIAPDYVEAAYYEGLVIDSITGTPLSNVTISFPADGRISDTTRFDGTFATGTAFFQSYQVIVSKPGYASQTFTVDLQEGSLVMDTIRMSPPVGIEELPLGVATVYPNPSNHQFVLDYRIDNGTQAQMSVYNMLGVVVEQQLVQGQQGQLRFGESLPAGLYLVRLESPKGSTELIRVTKQ